MRALIVQRIRMMHAALAAGGLRTLLILVACVSGAALALRTTMTTLSGGVHALLRDGLLAARTRGTPPTALTQPARAASIAAVHHAGSGHQREQDSLIGRLRRRRSLTPSRAGLRPAGRALLAAAIRATESARGGA